MGLFSCFRSSDPLQRTAEAYQWGRVGILALLLPVGLPDLGKEGVLISSSGASALLSDNLTDLISVCLQVKWNCFTYILNGFCYSLPRLSACFVPSTFCLYESFDSL